MRPHYVLGYGLAPVAFVHALPVMGERVIGADLVGIYVATGAAVLAVAQIGAGVLLRASPGRARRWLRYAHIAIASAIVLAVSAHVARDSIVLHMLRNGARYTGTP
jgi:hypothetical protein